MNSIKWKMVLLFILLVLLALAISGFYVVTNVQRSAYADTYDDMAYTAQRLIDTLMVAEPEDEAGLEQAFSDAVTTLMLESTDLDDERIYLLDERGATLYYREEAPTPADLTSRTVVNAISGDPDDSLYVHTIQQSEGDSQVGDYALAFQMEGSMPQTYVVFLRRSLVDVQERVHTTLLIFIMAAVIAIVIAGVLGYFLAETIAKPIQHLTLKTQAMAGGDLEAVEEKDSRKVEKDEIGELDENFSVMARSLKSMLQEMNSETEKLGTIFANMADGLVVYDRGGRVVECNPAAERLMGESIRYEAFHRAFAPHEITEILNDPRETQAINIEKKERYIQAVFAAYSEGLIVVLQDTTEQKQVEEMQKEFVANVSHELRTPITTIKSYVETLQDGASEDPDMAERFLGVINNEADRMTYLIAELLDLSRIDSRRVKLQMELQDLPLLLHENVLRNRILAEKKQQTLEMDPIHTACFVMGDEVRIGQVLRNLISNAVKYSPEHTDIRVGVVPMDQKVRIYVKDQGMGIEPKEQERIFERFYRVDKARSRSMGGTGLGLAISREIMEMHNGRIWVESQLGAGSTFWLEFPEAEGAGADEDYI